MTFVILSAVFAMVSLYTLYIHIARCLSIIGGIIEAHHTKGSFSARTGGAHIYISVISAGLAVLFAQL